MKQRGGWETEENEREREKENKDILTQHIIIVFMLLCL